MQKWDISNYELFLGLCSKCDIIMINLGQPDTGLVSCCSDGRTVTHRPQGWWFHPRLLQSACRSVLGVDTEPRVAPDVCVIVREWVGV